MIIKHNPSQITHTYQSSTDVQTALSGEEKQRAKVREGYLCQTNLSYDLQREEAQILENQLRTNDVIVIFADPANTAKIEILSESGNFLDVKLLSNADIRVLDQILTDAGDVLDCYAIEEGAYKLSGDISATPHSLTLLRRGKLTGQIVVNKGRGVEDRVQLSFSVILSDRQDDPLLAPAYSPDLRFDLGVNNPPTVYIPANISNFQATVQTGVFDLQSASSRFAHTGTFREVKRAGLMQLTFSDYSARKACENGDYSYQNANIIPKLLDYAKGEQKEFFFSAGESLCEIFDSSEDYVVIPDSVLQFLKDRTCPYLLHIGEGQSRFLRVQSYADLGDGRVRVAHAPRGFALERISRVYVVRFSGNISQNYNKQARNSWTFSLQEIAKKPNPDLAISEETTVYKLVFDCSGIYKPATVYVPPPEIHFSLDNPGLVLDEFDRVMLAPNLGTLPYNFLANLENERPFVEMWGDKLALSLEGNRFLNSNFPRDLVRFMHDGSEWTLIQRVRARADSEVTTQGWGFFVGSTAPQLGFNGQNVLFGNPVGNRIINNIFNLWADGGFQKASFWAYYDAQNVELVAHNSLIGTRHLDASSIVFNDQNANLNLRIGSSNPSNLTVAEVVAWRGKLEPEQIAQVVSDLEAKYP